MKKKNLLIIVLAAAIVSVMLLSGCSAGKKQDEGLEDGKYVATFTTDSSMFHINEAYHDKGILTVKNGKMTIHITLVSKNIVGLYQGTSKEAKNNKDKVLKPTDDKVHYDDGYNEEVYGFDVPVPYLKKDFDLALIGTHGKWYDHKVKVSSPKKLERGQDYEEALKKDSKE